VILIIFAALCVASVPLTGGHLSRVAHIRVRGLWLAGIALGIQLLITLVITSGSQTFHEDAHIVSYVFAGLFLWANRRLPGAPLIAAGAGSNALAIIVNHGVMPASAAAERAVGQKLGPGFHNAGPVVHAHLAWLGDIIPIPGPAHLHNVISIGDLLLYTGMLVLLHRVCRRPVEAPAESAVAAATATPEPAPEAAGPIEVVLLSAPPA
jgi:hypothetical protein